MPRLIKPSAEIVAVTPNILDVIEDAARICYLSEPKEASGEIARKTEQEKFLRDKIKRGHESVLEHGAITVDIVCDRGVTHEIVRHRIASYSQESTRYCNYSKDKFDSEITVINPEAINIVPDGDRTIVDAPPFSDAIQVNWSRFDIFMHAMCTAEWAYMKLIETGCTAQEARSVLPTILKTKIRMTANPCEWRHFFRLRTARAAHPQMREFAIPLLAEMKKVCPIIFDDIEVEA